MSDIFTTSGTTSYSLGTAKPAGLTCDGTITAKEFKVMKDPNLFYQYRLQVLALKELPKPDHNRLLLKVEATAELGPKANLRDYILLKHGAEIAALGSLEELTLDIVTIRTWTIE